MSYLVRFEVVGEITPHEEGKPINDLMIIDLAVIKYIKPEYFKVIKIRPCHVEPIEDEE